MVIQKVPRRSENSDKQQVSKRLHWLSNESEIGQDNNDGKEEIHERSRPVKVLQEVFQDEDTDIVVHRTHILSRKVIIVLILFILKKLTRPETNMSLLLMLLLVLLSSKTLWSG